MPPDQAQLRTPIRHGNSPQPPNDHTTTTHQRAQERPTQTAIRNIDDNTIETYTSTASTTLNSSYHANRFAELEAAIKANQQNFTSMNTQYQTMENKILETMTSCHENSKQLITMQGQMANMQTTIQSIADQMQFITRHLTNSKSATETSEGTLHSPVKKKQRHYEQSGGHRRLTYKVTETPTTPADYHQDTYTQDNGSTNADQEEAQYTETRSPDAALEE